MSVEAISAASFMIVFVGKHKVQKIIFTLLGMDSALL